MPKTTRTRTQRRDPYDSPAARPGIKKSARRARPVCCARFDFRNASPTLPCVPPYASARCGGLGMPAGHGSIEQHRSPALQRADRAFDNPTWIPMNHQGVSEIFFEESYTVPADQTAKSLFARLPHGSGYAERLIECLATGYLVAVIESICIREMQQHVDAAEVVVGRTIRIDHRGPIPPGSSLRLRGWLERMGERSATFRVQACDTGEVVCEAAITLVAVQRTVIETRIAAKVEALQRGHRPVGMAR